MGVLDVGTVRTETHTIIAPRTMTIDIEPTLDIETATPYFSDVSSGINLVAVSIVVCSVARLKRHVRRDAPPPFW